MDSQKDKDSEDPSPALLGSSLQVLGLELLAQIFFTFKGILKMDRED